MDSSSRLGLKRFVFHLYKLWAAPAALLIAAFCHTSADDSGAIFKVIDICIYNAILLGCPLEDIPHAETKRFR
jgi:hypothetical protein